jgi:hypothetical protein
MASVSTWRGQTPPFDLSQNAITFTLQLNMQCDQASILLFITASQAMTYFVHEVIRLFNLLPACSITVTLPSPLA